MLQLCKENDEQLVRNDFRKEVKILRRKIKELEEECKKKEDECMLHEKKTETRTCMHALF